jgi:hypothetical protein
VIPMIRFHALKLTKPSKWRIGIFLDVCVFAMMVFHLFVFLCFFTGPCSLPWSVYLIQLPVFNKNVNSK